MEKVKQFFFGKIVRVLYWLPEDMKKKVEQDAKARKYKNPSALMVHIINNWFAK